MSDQGCPSERFFKWNFKIEVKLLRSFTLPLPSGSALSKAEAGKGEQLAADRLEGRAGCQLRELMPPSDSPSHLASPFYLALFSLRLAGHPWGGAGRNSLLSVRLALGR